MREGAGNGRAGKPSVWEASVLFAKEEGPHEEGDHQSAGPKHHVDWLGNVVCKRQVVQDRHDALHEHQEGVEAQWDVWCWQAREEASGGGGGGALLCRLGGSIVIFAAAAAGCRPLPRQHSKDTEHGNTGILQECEQWSGASVCMGIAILAGGGREKRMVMLAALCCCFWQ